MSDFVRYQHVERIGLCGDELDGLLEGEVFVFPKLDGANHCVYFDKDLERVGIASRNQLLSNGYDSTKFWHFAVAHKGLESVVTEHPDWRIYGEFLTPHTLKNYKDYAWNKFYIFDVWDDNTGSWMTYDRVVAVGNLVKAGCDNPEDIEVIPPIGILKDPSVDDIVSLMDEDTYLLQDGTLGEGVVIKNYSYHNPYGRQTWGKIVREEFKTKFKLPNKGEKKELPEVIAVFQSVTKEFVSKEFHKFTTDRGVEWNMSMTPDFLKNIWQAWWEDYSFAILGGMKTVDMKAVRSALSKAVMGKLGSLRA